MIDDELQSLLKTLTALPHETEWAEFKHNNTNPDDIGEYLSALANSAALHRKESAYIVWGVSNDPGHPIVGTTFKPHAEKVGNEELENWLSVHLAPRVNFQIHEFFAEGKPVVIFCVQPTTSSPVRFKEAEFIRVGSYKKKLKDYPEKEKALWATFSQLPFEKAIAMPNVDSDQILNLIDYPAFFQLLKQSLPENRSGILERLVQEKVVVRKAANRFDVTNLGAILFARRLVAFDRLSRKSLRIMIYRGANRVETVREQTGDRGYAVGFEGAIRYINDRLPQNEQIGQALRREVRMYPEIAIRELVANALIHQDLTITGAGPTVEVFADRMEIANPGTPLIDTLRFIDEPPQSRNEAVAASMRRMNICEERGSGVDKVIFNVELFQLPAPKFTVTQDHTQAVLFAYKKLSKMDKDDRIRACYQHACLCCVSNDRMTNASLRKRFSIKDENYSIASRIIAETLESKLIKPFDPKNLSRKHIKYVPFWA